MKLVASRALCDTCLAVANINDRHTVSVYSVTCSANDETSARSVAMCLSLTTVMKEWGIHKSSMERQVSFAMKDISKSSFKAGIVNKFKQSKKVKSNAQL